MQEKQVRSMGGEDPLEKQMTTHSSTLAWEIPRREEPGGLQSMGLQKSQTQLKDSTTIAILLEVIYLRDESICPHANLYMNAYDIQFNSVTQSCLALCGPMNHSTPGLPVHHQLLEFTQTHVIISHPSPPAPSPSQHHSLFQ